MTLAQGRGGRVQTRYEMWNSQLSIVGWCYCIFLYSTEKIPLYTLDSSRVASVGLTVTLG